jgi:hypothetical protein
MVEGLCTHAHNVRQMISLIRTAATLSFVFLLLGCGERRAGVQPRAEGREPRADRRELKAESRELTAESREPQTDTVARLVRRYVAQPAALQRVSGQATTHVALRPLDSLLAVRVLDSRGAELDSVAVTWTMVDPADGATLRVINPVTDSLGVSRAAFSPGLSANAQHVIAEVAGVGRITFPVTVAARMVRHAPTAIIIWAGEDVTVSAALRDSSGNVLTGGNIAWASSDTSTARVSAAGTSAPVTALAAGSAEIFSFAETGKVRGATRVTVRPVVRGRIVTLDGSTTPDLNVELESGDIRETIPAVRGIFTARIPFHPGADVVVRIPQPSPGYHVAAVRVGTQRELQSLAIALVPTRFTIDAGTYEGQAVAIDAAVAMRPGSRGAPFWRVVPLSGTTPRKLLGWREAEYPLRVAFNRPASRGSIDAQDSVAFWNIADVMERDLGRDLFTPADLSDSARGTIVRVELRPQSSEGHTFVAWEQAGDAHEGVVILREQATLRDAHVVTHELVHLLGFGHASVWSSVSQAEGVTARRLSMEDVAYIQLAMRLRSLQERTGARPGLPSTGLGR